MPTEQQKIFATNLDHISHGRIREWVELFHPDGVLEFPYGPPGVPSRFQGHDELYEHMKDFPRTFEVTFSGLTFHETVDPQLVIAEFVGTGRGVVTKRPFHQVYISVVRFRDGRIVSFRDFWNPLQTIKTALTLGQVLKAGRQLLRRASPR
jgi:hypothetical protein